MRTLQLCADHGSDFILAGTPLRLGVVDEPEPAFDPAAPGQRECVVVRVTAFSCNFRDRAIIASYGRQIAHSGWPQRVGFGSEFSGVVVAVGVSVVGLRVGDRVLPDASYPDTRATFAQPGVVTNNVSRGYHVLHEAKLLRMPDTMDDAIGATFSLGAQTAASMVRKASPPSGSKVLVLSARSATSLFLISLLRDLNLDVVAATTSNWTANQLKLVQPARVVTCPQDGREWTATLGSGFSTVLDPFADLNASRALPLLAQGGRYVTCGVQQQDVSFATEGSRVDVSAILAALIMGNLLVIGNCLGTTADLVGELERYDRTGSSPVPLDSVFGVEEGVAFMERSFVSRDRFGKVVLSYTAD